jgi:hypothetical protein
LAAALAGSSASGCKHDLVAAKVKDEASSRERLGTTKHPGFGFNSFNGTVTDTVCLSSNKRVMSGEAPVQPAVQPGAAPAQLRLTGDDDDTALPASSAGEDGPKWVEMSQAEVDDWYAKTRGQVGTPAYDYTDVLAGGPSGTSGDAVALKLADAPGGECNADNLANCRIPGFDQVEFTFNIYESLEQATNSFKGEAEGRITYGVVSAEAKASYEQASNSTSKTQYMVLTARLKGKAFKLESTAPTVLATRYNALMAGAAEAAPGAAPVPAGESIQLFQSACGDKYVTDLFLGGTFLGVGTITNRTSQSNSAWRAQVNIEVAKFAKKFGGGGGSVTAGGDSSTLNQMSQSNFKVIATGTGFVADARDFEGLFNNLKRWYDGMKASESGVVIGFGVADYAGRFVEGTEKVFPRVFEAKSRQVAQVLNPAIRRYQRIRIGMAYLTEGTQRRKLEDLSKSLLSGIEACMADRFDDTACGERILTTPDAAEGELDAIADQIRAAENETICGVRKSELDPQLRNLKENFSSYDTASARGNAVPNFMQTADGCAAQLDFSDALRFSLTNDEPFKSNVPFITRMGRDPTFYSCLAALAPAVNVQQPGCLELPDVLKALDCAGKPGNADGCSR